MAITSMNLASAMTKLVAVDTLPAIWGQMVVGNLVRRDFEPVVVAQGDSATIPVYPLGEKSIVIDTLCEATFQIPDVTKVIAVPDLLRLYMQSAIVSIAERIDEKLLRLVEKQPEMTRTEASDALFARGVVAGQFIVTTANLWRGYHDNNRFGEYQTAGDAGMRELVEGPVGRLDNAFVLRSRYAKQGVMFSKQAVALVTRRLPRPLSSTGAVSEYCELGNFGMRVSMDYQPNTITQQFTLSVLFGVDILRDGEAFRLSD